MKLESLARSQYDSWLLVINLVIQRLPQRGLELEALFYFVNNVLGWPVVISPQVFNCREAKSECLPRISLMKINNSETNPKFRNLQIRGI